VARDDRRSGYPRSDASLVGRPPEDQPVEGDHLWNLKEVSTYLGVNPRSTYKMDLPKVYLSQRTIRFEPAVIKQWVAGRRATHTGGKPRGLGCEG
jgi:hypothetical protein